MFASRNLEEALNEFAEHKPLIIFYAKVSIPRRLSKKGTEGDQGTVPMRFDNQDKNNLCYINTPIQALFNIYSLKKDLAE